MLSIVDAGKEAVLMKPAVYFRFIKCTPVLHIVQILCDVGFCGVKRLFLCTAAFGKQKGA